ncbi:hypothetical protein GCM10010405_43550 [Streptomyces macrosporus]|uniref:Uncharacterized protein n=1 Tax=Streptomyces macrosporus TaxID=44032 RepID=A0ABP5XFX2_9ACTN
MPARPGREPDRWAVTRSRWLFHHGRTLRSVRGSSAGARRRARTVGSGSQVTVLPVLPARRRVRPALRDRGAGRAQGPTLRFSAGWGCGKPYKFDGNPHTRVKLRFLA